MQTLDRLNARLDEMQNNAPRVVGAWMKLNRALAGRASTFVTSAAAGLSGSARKVAETTADSARAVGKSVDSSAKKVARTAEREIVDVTEDATARVEASTEAADEVRLSQMTKESLYEHAQTLDIDGRSQMTKTELIEAIMAAGDAAQPVR